MMWKDGNKPLHTLYTHPEEARQMGRNGRNLAEREFNLEHYTYELSVILKDMARTKAHDR